jgi:hypothetical protein
MGADSTDRRAGGRRSQGGGFFSTTFGQPAGTLVGEGGYYIDFRVKAPVPRWPPPQLVGADLWVVTAQWGLGAHEHFLHSEDETWLAGALGAGEKLVAEQREDGAWVHSRPYPHTYRLSPPWLSAMAQGEGASLLVRLYAATGDERFADAALRALGPLAKPVDKGGVLASLDGGPWYEEYPTTPASYVLNGGIFALWGLRDVGLRLSDEFARRAFEEGLDCLAAHLHWWDTGWWSVYDLHPHRAKNISSPAYHELHITQLGAMQAVEPRAQLSTTLARFERYAASRVSRGRALAAKVAFRLLVPRR